MVKTNKSRKKKSPSVLGANRQLPEGVFGILDDLTPSFQVERLHEAPWDRDRREAKEEESRKKRKRKKAKAAKKHRDDPTRDMALPKMQINDEAYEDHLPDLEYVNAVEVPEALLNKIRDKTDIRTRDFSNILMSRMMPTFLGLEAAQSYTVSAMRDALGVEVEMDDSVLESAKALANLDMTFYFLRRSTLPKKFKHLYLETLVVESAKAASAAMNERNEKDKHQKRLADFQSVVSRGMSSMQRREDKKRRATSEDDDNQVELFGSAPEKKRSSNVGALRTRGRGP